MSAISDARRNWLDAGVRRLRNAREVVNQALSQEGVAEEAGRSVSSMKSLWPRMDQYVRELLGYLMQGERYRSYVEIPSAVARLPEAADPLGALIDLLRRDFELVSSDETFRAQLLLMGGQADDATANAIRRMYRDFDEALVPAITTVLAHWQRKPVEPWTALDLSITFSSLAEGFAMRSWFDSDVKPDQYVYSVLAQLVTLTTPNTNPSTLAQAVAPIASWNPTKN